MNAPMTAAELAKMLEGWPEGARPEMELIEGAFAWEAVGFAFTIRDAHAIDLACMSGLRWLLFVAKGDFAVGETIDGGIYLDLLDPNLGWGETLRSNSGPTLLHAIDAAIRGSK